MTPIGASHDYATDGRRALRFQPLIDSGHAATLPELAVRYVISNPELSTVEIGIATHGEFEQAVDAVNKGPLSPDTLSAIKSLQTEFI